MSLLFLSSNLIPIFLCASSPATWPLISTLISRCFCYASLEHNSMINKLSYPSSNLSLNVHWYSWLSHEIGASLTAISSESDLHQDAACTRESGGDVMPSSSHTTTSRQFLLHPQVKKNKSLILLPLSFILSGYTSTSSLLYSTHSLKILVHSLSSPP